MVGLVACGPQVGLDDAGLEEDGGTVGADGGDASELDPADYPDCRPADNTLSATFSIAIDGALVEVDRSQDWISDPIAGEWPADGAGGPLLDGPCAVLGSAEGFVQLQCLDRADGEHVVEVWFSSSVAFAPDFAREGIELFYDFRFDYDELYADPPTIAHGFAVSVGDEIILAGIDGQFSSVTNPRDLWPDALPWSTREDPCPPTHIDMCDDRLRSLVEVGLPSGVLLQALDGTSTVSGNYALAVETATDIDVVHPELAECGWGEEFGVSDIVMLLGRHR